MFNIFWIDLLIFLVLDYGFMAYLTYFCILINYQA